MAQRDGRFVITYNGEIYNFRELRGELERLGHRFRSRTDTEVVLAAYAAVGRRRASSASTGCSRSRSGTATRASCSSPATASASSRSTTPRSARCSSSARRSRRCSRTARVRRASSSLPHLLEYFTFQNIFTDGTLFEGVRLLPPGHRARPCRAGSRRRVRPARYWDFDFREPDGAARSDAEYEEELDRLFRQAVKRQLVSDVPVGAYLSGGMDSGSITAVAAAGAAVHEHVHRRLRHDLGRRARAGLRRARQGRGDVLPVPDRALRGGAQVRRHGALPARAGLAPRGSARRAELPELLRRPAGQQVREGRAVRAGRRRALRRLPVALLPRRRQRRLRRLHRQVLRLLAAARPQRACCRELFAPRVWSDVKDLRTIDIFRDAFPDTRAPHDARRTTSTTRSTSRPRPSCHGLLRRRGQAEHGARPRDPRAVPGQRPRRLRACASRSA